MIFCSLMFFMVFLPRWWNGRHAGLKILCSQGHEGSTPSLGTRQKNIGSNHILRNREFLFAPKTPYDLVAERSEATSESLTFPTWCPWWESNPQALLGAEDFKSSA